MKKGPMLISKLAGLPVSKKYIAVCIALASLMLTGCYQQFYARGTKEPPATRDLINVRDWNKEIILHFEDSIVHLQQMTLNNDTLTGLPAILPMELSKQLKPKRNRSTGYQARLDTTVTNQAHIYVLGQLLNYAQEGEPMIQIPHEKIQRMDVYERDGAAIAFNYTISTLGIIICLGIPVLLLVASFF